MNASRTLVLSMIIVISGCVSTSDQVAPKTLEGKVKDNGEIPAFRKAAEERLKGQIEYLWNQSKSHVICIQHDKTLSREAAMHSPSPFIIYDIANSKVLHEDKPLKATILWASDSVVQISLSPGMVHGDEENNPGESGYFYDVLTQQKSFDFSQ